MGFWSLRVDHSSGGESSKEEMIFL